MVFWKCESRSTVYRALQAMRGYPRSLARGSLRPPLHPPEQGFFLTPAPPRGGRIGAAQRTTRPFRLDLTRGFRSPWNHDQEYPSWTWTSICWTDHGLAPPLEPGRYLRRRQPKGDGHDRHD